MGRNKVEYKCEKCGYTTNKKGHYLNHKSRKTSCDRKKIYKDVKNCSYCKKSFKGEKSIYNHLKICNIKKKVDEYISENKKLLEQQQEDLQESIYEKEKLKLENEKLNKKIDELKEKLKLENEKLNKKIDELKDNLQKQKFENNILKSKNKIIKQNNKVLEHNINVAIRAPQFNRVI